MLKIRPLISPIRSLLFISIALSSGYLKAVEEKISLEQNLKQKNNKNWEFGFGIGGINVAHYIGSEDSRNITIPLPYVKYQGKFIKADRRGVRGVFWKNKKLEINMSFDFSLPVESKNNSARTGMPDLEFGIELGPAIDYLIFESEDYDRSVNFKWPLRAALELGSDSPSYYGWITSPSIQFQYRQNGWKSTTHFSVEYADQEYHSYFYNVDEKYVTEARPFFSSDKGLLNYTVGTRLSQRVNQWFYGAFINYVNLKNSASIQSPLIKKHENLNFGAFIIWVF